MNQVVTIENTAIAAMSESQIISVLRSSLYLGASDDSIKMVLAYCQASKLDPMQKPVHLVPMWDSKSSSMRDVVMPGIGLYRTQAARSGEYAGVSEPEFGPDIEENIGGTKIIYPASCRVTVKRKLSDGTIAEFSATERWKENYAVKGGKEKSIAPNAMWTKRPYGQIAKCAEAQALRKAFPEVGSQPTADEMEGREYGDAVETEAKKIESKPTLPELTAEQLAKRVADKTDNDGVVTFGARYKIENGEATAEDFITFLSAKFTLSDEIKTEINSWSAK